MDRWIVARIGKPQIARGRIENAEKERDEAVAGAGGASGLVEPRHETAQVAGAFRQHMDAGVEEGHHHERRRHALARNIARAKPTLALGDVWARACRRRS